MFCQQSVDDDEIEYALRAIIKFLYIYSFFIRPIIHKREFFLLPNIFRIKFDNIFFLYGGYGELKYNIWKNMRIT